MLNKSNDYNENDRNIISNAFKSDIVEIPDELMPNQVAEILEGVKPKRFVHVKRYAALAAALLVCVVSAALCINMFGFNGQTTIIESDAGYDVNEYTAEDYSKLYDILKSDSFKNDVAVAESANYAQTSDKSQTNIQVNGVDEADMLKTDGKYLYSVKDSKIIITSAVNGKTEIVSQLKLGPPFYVRELYLKDSYLIAVADYYSNEAADSEGKLFNSAVNKCLVGDTTTSTYICVYDVSDPLNAKKINDFYQDGDYLSSRFTNGCLYTVTDYYYYYTGNKRPKKKDIEKYVPGVVVNGVKQFVSPDSIAYSENKLGATMTVISGYNIYNNDKEIDVESFLGDSGIVYATKSDLYLFATNNSFKLKNIKTEIYRYSLNNGNLNREANGQVSGWMLNQFSADEYNGYLRIATSYYKNKKEMSAVTVLDKSLKQIGIIGEIAPNETIYSARFMNDIVYLVTFEQVDPFFTISLEDPANPVILGKLKIPGFSSYLHNVSNNLVLGIGRLNRKIIISLFDVSDLKNPKEIDSAVIDKKYYSDSEALYTHKAFTSYNGKYYIPVSNNKTGASVVEIEIRDNKLNLRYSEESADLGRIERTAVIDDYIYAMGYNGFYVYDIPNLVEVGKMRTGMKDVDPFIYKKPKPYKSEKVITKGFGNLKPDAALTSRNNVIDYAWKIYKEMLSNEKFKHKPTEYVSYDEYSDIWEVDWDVGYDDHHCSVSICFESSGTIKHVFYANYYYN